MKFSLSSNTSGSSVRRSGLAGALGGLLILFCGTAPLLAQTGSSSGAATSTIDQRIRETAPRPRPRGKEIDVKVPKPAAAPTGAAEINLRIILSAVVIEGATVFEPSSFGSDYEEFLAQEISIEEIAQILERITQRYRDAGYPLSRAVAPPQDIESGILTVRIIEGYLEQVRFSGDAENTDQFAGYGKRLSLHRPLSQADLERYTLAISDVSGYDVEPVLTAIDEDKGIYALELKLSHKLIDGVSTIDNRGTPEVGRFQTWLSAGINSALGMRERIQLGFFTTPPQPEESLYYELYYSQPIGFEGTAFSLDGALSRSDAGSSDAANDTESELEKFRLSVWHPLIRSRDENLWLRGTFEYRNFHETQFGRTSTNDRLRILRGRLGYWRNDFLGGTLSASAQISRGLNILGESSTGSNDLSRFDGESEFTKINLDLVRDQNLFGNFWLQVEVAGQITDDRMLSPEEFSVGGNRFGRGYDFAEISGDEGFAISIEPRYWWNVQHKWLSSITFYGFYDWGIVRNDFSASEDTDDSAASAGGGFRLKFPHEFEADFEIAWPLTRPVETTDGNEPRLFFSLRKNY